MNVQWKTSQKDSNHRNVNDFNSFHVKSVEDKNDGQLLNRRN